ncbi:MAG: phosphodiester glycosidase family protein [Clostridia bacterium]|nr:phosphodiester glycosidase family protein [Clostridia bacterium]
MAEQKRTPSKATSFMKVFKKKRVLIPLIAVLLIAIMYVLFVFSSIPFIKFWRTIYIETAMTTADHQWLATAFIPGYIIDDVMSKQTDTSQVIGGAEHLAPVTETTEAVDTDTDTEPVPDTTPAPETTSPVVPDEPADILGQSELTVGEEDYAGYTVLINDIEQGIVVSEIVGSTYRGKIMLIDDPSRVYLGSTPYKHKEGLRIKAMMLHHGAIAGINASGFNDPNDSGHGGDVIGLSFSEGEYWGTAVSYYGSVLITSDDRLVVGNVKDWQYYDIRAGIQFGPVLIADGKSQIEGSGGYGIQPRTAIGQREDGVIVFLVIDGRQPTWSIGCTMGDLVEILQKYGVVNAACCDGGSSSVMAYNGEVINKNSSLNPTYGRRLPNAWLVTPKESARDTEEAAEVTTDE